VLLAVLRYAACCPKHARAGMPLPDQARLQSGFVLQRYAWRKCRRLAAQGQVTVTLAQLTASPPHFESRLISERCKTVGDSSALLYAGHDWADAPLARRSLELMAEKVMPAVNAATG